MCLNQLVCTALTADAAMLIVFPALWAMQYMEGLTHNGTTAAALSAQYLLALASCVTPTWFFISSCYSRSPTAVSDDHAIPGSFVVGETHACLLSMILLQVHTAR